jgi:hypothetical protein
MNDDDRKKLDRIFGRNNPTPFDTVGVWRWLLQEAERDLDVSSPKAEANNALRLNLLLRLASELGFKDLAETQVSELAQISPSTWEKLLAHAPNQ